MFYGEVVSLFLEDVPEKKEHVTYKNIRQVRLAKDRCLARLRTDLDVSNSKEFAVYYGPKDIDVYCHLNLDHPGYHEAICYAREDAMWYVDWEEQHEPDES